ncbi:hypothetical protein ASPSYDRAFT_43510, partial [Aspergillus sydowii CBS 593.65]
MSDWLALLCPSAPLLQPSLWMLYALYWSFNEQTCHKNQYNNKIPPLIDNI